MATIKINDVYLKSSYVVAGKKEKEGPLSKYYHETFNDNYLGEKSFEKSEIKMFKKAIEGAIYKSGLNIREIELAIGGDLSNQIVTSNYLMREYNIPFIGTYSACSTLALNFSLASFFIDRGYFNNIIIFTGSHYNTAERQFRNPCEYGGQRKDCSTSTVTGAGAFILTNEKSKIKVGSITIGRVIDYKVKDVNDMGTAMSPSAFDTFKRHLKDLSIEPSYYDLILTGDLSKIGKNLFEKMCESENIKLNNNYNDSGLMVYDVNKQKVYSGGSGCGCIAITTGGYIVEKLLNYEYKRVLIIATGALLSPLIIYQKETIPCISHAFSLEVDSWFIFMPF